MENKENTINKANKAAETLAKELEGLTNEGLHEFFVFFYKLNHVNGYMITNEKFEEFLEAFDSNPFKINDNQKFRKELIQNILKYAHDHMSLITAAVLIKKKFTLEELIQNLISAILIRLKLVCIASVFDQSQSFQTGSNTTVGAF
jgi:uncharacterized protein YeeX (DUF496 family)